MNQSGEKCAVMQRELSFCATMKANTRSTRSPYEIALEKGFVALKQFMAREGHCRVLRVLVWRLT
jgi:hypothetical protein